MLNRADKKRLLEISNGLYYNNMILVKARNQRERSMDSNQLHDHIVNTGKVMAGGAGVGGTTYAAVAHMDLPQATAIAGFCAATMTAVYFAVSAGYALWKWRREANASGSK